jgi:hypothetical protein
MQNENRTIHRTSSPSPKVRVIRTYSHRACPLWGKVRETPWVAFMRGQAAVSAFANPFVR